MFAITGDKGLLRLASSIRYTKENLYNVTVIAFDLGEPSLASSAVISVGVLDDSNGPHFTHDVYHLNVESTTQINTTLMTLLAGTGAYKYHALGE